MTIGRWTKNFATALGAGAVVALVVIGAVNSGRSSDIDARGGGSGNSQTTPLYASPTVPAISLSVTLSSGVTVSSSSPPTKPATPKAVPTVTLSSTPPCSLNGVVLPGGCH